MFQANDKGNRITLAEAAPVLFLSSILNMFLFPGVFLKATTHRNFEKQCHLKVQELSGIHIAQFLRSETVVCSAYSKKLKFYEKRLQQRYYSSEIAARRRLYNWLS